MLELARRGVMAACLFIGLWLFFLPDTTPLWTLGPAPRAQSAAGETLVVSGPLWQAFFRQAETALAGEKAERAFARRLGRGPDPEGVTGALLYFKYYDPPLADLGRPRTALLRLEETGQALTLGVLAPHPDGDGAFAPPGELTHPWRRIGWKAWPAGLLTALFLPWPGRGPNVLRWPRRRLLAQDLCWIALTGLCFGLPLSLFYGQPFVGLPRSLATLALWAVAALGLALARAVARRAASGALLTKDGVTLFTPGGDIAVAFAELDRVEALPPAGPTGLGPWFLGWPVRLERADGERLLLRLGEAGQVDRLVRAWRDRDGPGTAAGTPEARLTGFKDGDG